MVGCVVGEMQRSQATFWAWTPDAWRAIVCAADSEIRQEVLAVAYVLRGYTDLECAAVDDGLAALERLCTDLADVPTPAGSTPRQLRSGSRLELPVLPSGEPNYAGAIPSARLEKPATQC